MKSNWPAWVADFRSHLDDPESSEAKVNAEMSIEDAEEFLAWLENGPREPEPLEEVEHHLARVRSDFERVMSVEDDDEMRMRQGNKIYEQIKGIRDEIVALDRATVPSEDIARVADSLTSLTQDMLIKIFKTTFDEIEEGLAEFRQRITNE